MRGLGITGVGVRKAAYTPRVGPTWQRRMLEPVIPKMEGAPTTTPHWRLFRPSLGQEQQSAAARLLPAAVILVGALVLNWWAFKD